MAAQTVRRLAYAALPTLYLLHNDLWFWHDARRFLGLPVGLTYHLLFTGAVVLVMGWLVRSAWPAALDRLAGCEAGGEASGGGREDDAPPERRG